MEINRRTIIQGIGAIPFSGCTPTIATTYTVEQHVDELEQAGFTFTAYPNGFYVGFSGTEADGGLIFTPARKKAEAAGIDTTAICEFLNQRDARP